jgi:hypothetical protein
MDDHPWPCVVHRSVREAVERVNVCGRCWEVALGDGRRSPYHLGRRRDTGQPGESIDIPINTGEQSSLALPTGEDHESLMDMQLPMRS